MLSVGCLIYLHTTTKLSTGSLPNGRWESRELESLRIGSGWYSQEGTELRLTLPNNWLWTTVIPHLPVISHQQGESWTEVPVPNGPPSWHHSAPPASQGHDREEARQNGFQGQAKGKVHRERSQLCPQDLPLSLPGKDSCFTVHPLLLAGRELHGERVIAVTRSCPVLQAAESWLDTDGSACLLPAPLCALYQKSERQPMAISYHLDIPWLILKSNHLQGPLCIQKHSALSVGMEHGGLPPIWPGWSSYLATASWETRRNMSHCIMSLVIEGVASQHMAGKHNTRNFGGHSKLPVDTVWVCAQQLH